MHRLVRNGEWCLDGLFSRGPDAARAGVHACQLPAEDEHRFLNVRSPHSPRLVVRVAHVVSECNLLATELAATGHRCLPGSFRTWKV